VSGELISAKSGILSSTFLCHMLVTSPKFLPGYRDYVELSVKIGSIKKYAFSTELFALQKCNTQWWCNIRRWMTVLSRLRPYLERNAQRKQTGRIRVRCLAYRRDWRQRRYRLIRFRLHDLLLGSRLLEQTTPGKTPSRHSS
jgi:hypothetical protein